MRTAMLVVFAAAALAPAWCQEPAPAPGSPVVKVVELKYSDPRSIESMLALFSCNIRPNQSTRTLTLRCPPGEIKAVEEAIRRFDVPAKQIELTAWFLVASEKPVDTGAPVPPELDPVVKQMRSVFAYKNFALLDTQLIRAAGGAGGEVTGQVNNPGSSQPTLTKFKVLRWSVRPGDKGDVVSIDTMRAGLDVPVPDSTKSVKYLETGLQLNSVDVPVGQKVVIGKSSMDGPGKALVIVLTANVL